MTQDANKPDPKAAPDTSTIGGNFQAGLKKGFEGIKGTPDTAKDGAGVAADAAANAEGVVDKTKKKTKGFFDDLEENGGIGKILGFLLGLGGAFFAGNFFGGGIMGTILTVALAFPLAIIGSEKIGGVINGWLGHKETKRERVPASELAAEHARVAAEQEAAKVKDTPAASPDKSATASAAPAAGGKPGITLTEAELNALMQTAQSQGKPINTLVLAGKEMTPTFAPAGSTDTEISTAKIQELMGVCKSTGQEAALHFTPIDTIGNVKPGCVPKVAVAAANSPSRGS